MRTNLEVLNSFDLIITTSIMQSADERENQRISMRTNLEVLAFVGPITRTSDSECVIM